MWQLASSAIYVQTLKLKLEQAVQAVRCATSEDFKNSIAINKRQLSFRIFSQIM